ncbi:MAG: GHKL domain-containing protein [Acidobacteria bacterium]|nr:GHKL domain-containing protein [Acidobacteriota bacterium]
MTQVWHDSTDRYSSPEDVRELHTFSRMRQTTQDTETYSSDYARAILNILEDFTDERGRISDTQKAILNILDDFGGEKQRLEYTQKAVLNILDDFGGEKSRLEHTQKAVLNILEDFSGEKERLEATQKAMLNLLDDFNAEKGKVEASNEGLRHEIAERRQAEQSLLEKSEALIRSNAELEQFAYVASHDLQEPLRMVSSYMQLFAERYQGKVDERADKYIRYAVEGAKQMQSLIAGLLEYSRVGREQHLTRVEAVSALERALSNLDSRIQESGASVTYDPLPLVHADFTQLVQIFQNLISNAMKFRKADEEPHVHISATAQDQRWVFTVEDNGIGIAPEHTERIFVIFQRLHTRSEYPGTGIGLSVCKKAVERQGGRIWVESEPGLGSRFCFTLPQREVPS